MTMTTMGLVCPHLHDLGDARHGVAHGSANDSTFAITHHDAQCSTVVPTYGALVAPIETILDGVCLNWRTVVTGLVACCGGTIAISNTLKGKRASQALLALRC